MLTPRKRITKKTLKEDKLITYSVQARDWLEENMKLVLGGIAVAVLVVVAVLFITNSRQKAEATASVELASAVRVYESRDYSNAVTLFTNIVNSAGSSKSGKIGRFYLAQSLFKTNEYAAAAEHYRKFSSSFSGDDYLKATALAGEAACLEQQDQFAEAAKKFESVARKYSDAPHAARYLFRAARCNALAGNGDAAQSLYQKIIDDHPDSPEKEDAVLYSFLE